jgi:hypothetical protein
MYRHFVLSGMLAICASACEPTRSETDEIGSDSTTETESSTTTDDGTTDDGTTEDDTTEDGTTEDGTIGDVFDSDEVYVLGAVSGEPFPNEEGCIPLALAHWSAPNVAASGFDCFFDRFSGVIRPSDGRFLHLHEQEGRILEFHCDTCPLLQFEDYPLDTMQNDTPLASECSVAEFLLAPSGDYLVRCDEAWYDRFGELVYEQQAGPLLHLGNDGLAMTSASVVDLGSGAATPIEGFPHDNIPGGGFTRRADPEGGFFVVVGSAALPKLVHVGPDGSSTELGTYPPLPPDVNGTNEMALDGSGVLFQLGYGVLLRRELEGTSEVVQSESRDTLVALSFAELLTGP